MQFFVVPYLLAVDLVVPSERFDYKPTFFFHVTINSSAETGPELSATDYSIKTIMSCTPDPISLWCCFKDTTIRHDQKLFVNSINENDPNRFVITNEKFLLEFDESGVKISGCNEKSERSRRMIQKIVDLLNLDVNFNENFKRGTSEFRTVRIIDNCPIETNVTFRRSVDASAFIENSKKGFFKLTSHPDDFDETAPWKLDVNRTKNIPKCKNFQDFFFGSRGQEDVLHGYKLVSNVTSSFVEIRITNENFTSTGYTEGTMTSKTMSFIAKDKITVSIALGDIYVPSTTAMQ